jgi:hypothetical protein
MTADLDKRSWQEMRKEVTGRLEARTGRSLGEWRREMSSQGFSDRPSLRAWLGGQGITGYPAIYLTMEHFGYPDFLLAGADELIEEQYADRPALRPVLDAVIEVARTLGDVTVQARKTYVSLVGPRRTFASVEPTTRIQVDLGLRLKIPAPSGRLQRSTSMRSGAALMRIALSSAADVDLEVQSWLRRSYDANL